MSCGSYMMLLRLQFCVHFSGEKMGLTFSVYELYFHVSFDIKVYIKSMCCLKGCVVLLSEVFKQFL